MGISSSDGDLVVVKLDYYYEIPYDGLAEHNNMTCSFGL